MHLLALLQDQLRLWLRGRLGQAGQSELLIVVLALFRTYSALVDRVTLTDSGFADHLLSNSSGDRYPRAECRLLRL
jgi:hypothetical protein